MPDAPKVSTAAEFDAMTLDERKAEFRTRIITDLASLPEGFRNRVVATAKRLGEERHQTADD